MSSDEDSQGSPLKPATPTSPLPGERERARNKAGRNAELLRHQQSFEARYSSIIQNQIWETSINKDVLERQLNAYFPFARSASLNKDAPGAFDQLLKPTSSADGGTLKTRSVGTTPTKQRAAVCLEKLDTLDIAEQSEQSQSESKS
ncbi:CG13332 [Drosophila busckii]|uniref:CG13332 n=1 Tax=Drosophila busckii TaxID=30019 RepID=A0A0M4E5N7_DROBS|nr:uncharacterized protein LOC108597103 [Drosophila busckii]ALC41628.1 CG13332 [Drosophila busckii]